jgi:hypothetical protein
MHRAIPLMSEHAHELKPRLQSEHEGHKKPRLQMLDVLASGQAHPRQEVARLLGVPRHPMGRWLALRRPAGVASDEGRRPWRRRTHGVEVKDQTLSPIGRRRFRATRKVPRPRHTKNA